MIEQPNRGKRSVGIDLTTPEGHEVLMKLVATADVFLTNYLPHVREKLAHRHRRPPRRQPRHHHRPGLGRRARWAPTPTRAATTAPSFWARGGVGVSMPDREGWPPGQPTPAFGDVMGGLATAGAIAAALVKRERTGEASVVDVSLLATAMWQVSPMIIASKLFGFSKIPQGDRTRSPNPGVGHLPHRGRPLHRADPAAVRQALGRLRAAPRRARHGDRPEVRRLRRPGPERRRSASPAWTRRSAARPLDYWKEALATFDGVWSPFQTLDELYEDVQVQANGYLPTMTAGNGEEVQLVASPAQFDEQPIQVERAPEHGEHTELVLMEAGLRLGPDRRHEGVGRHPLTARPRGCVRLRSGRISWASSAAKSMLPVNSPPLNPPSVNTLVAAV